MIASARYSSRRSAGIASLPMRSDYAYENEIIKIGSRRQMAKIRFFVLEVCARRFGLLGCVGFSPGGCPDTQSIGIDAALAFVTHRMPDKM
jgi:hypothetical protein